jgi:hypothetical protein
MEKSYALKVTDRPPALTRTIRVAGGVKSPTLIEAPIIIAAVPAIDAVSDGAPEPDNNKAAEPDSAPDAVSVADAENVSGAVPKLPLPSVPLRLITFADDPANAPLPSSGPAPVNVSAHVPAIDPPDMSVGVKTIAAEPANAPVPRSALDPCPKTIAAEPDKSPVPLATLDPDPNTSAAEPASAPDPVKRPVPPNVIAAVPSTKLVLDIAPKKTGAKACARPKRAID